MKVSLQDTLAQLLHSLNTVSRRPIYEKYDKNVQGNTVLERGQVVASVTACFRDFPELDQTHAHKSVAIGTGGNPNYAKIDPQYAAEQAICEAALRVAAVGGEWLGATDCLNFGNPEKPAQMGQFVAGVNGVKTACESLNVPIVSGNVSLYNESDGTSIPPSAIVSVFARVDAPKQVPTFELPETASLFFIGKFSDELGGSELLNLMDKSDARLPELDYARVQSQSDLIRKAIDQGLVDAINLVATGGLWRSAVEMIFTTGNRSLQLDLPTDISVPGALFGESLGLVVATTKPAELTKLMGELAIPVGGVDLGTKESKISHKNESLWTGNLSEFEVTWQNQLRTVV